MKNKLLILGAGGHAKVVADMARLNGYTEIAFLADRMPANVGTECHVLGACMDFVRYPEADIIVAIGDADARGRLVQQCLQAGRCVVTLVHPQAVVAQDVQLGAGTVVMAGAVINPASRVGKGCIINTGATVDHDNRIADYVHLSPGVHLAGTVEVGDYAWLGVGANVRDHIRICPHAIIGVGAAVVKDITEPGTYIGVPARKMIKEQDNMIKRPSVRRGGMGELADYAIPICLNIFTPKPRAILPAACCGLNEAVKLDEGRGVV